MDEPVNIVFGNSFSDSLSTFNMDVLEIKVSAPPIQIDVLRDWLDRITWLGNPVQQYCKPRRNGGRFLRAKVCSLDRIPTGFQPQSKSDLGTAEVSTIIITRPKSPVNLRCRFNISSRNGTTTVHPFPAISNQNMLLIHSFTYDYLVDSQHSAPKNQWRQIQWRCGLRIP